ncbi:MAG: hypothetical protein KDI19_09660 [Pseudomonadales bacterium]|nr:hypothetical protein [Pseudomonadales bacterium]
MVIDAFAAHPTIELAPPTGAFYAFPRVRGVADSYAFAEGLLKEESVGVAPGYTFGPGNTAHFRLCYALGHERLAEGLSRISRFAERFA